MTSHRGAASCRPSSLGQPQGSAGGVAVVGSNWLSCGGSPIGSGQDCSRFEPDAPVSAVRGTAAEPPESTRLRGSLRGPERRLSPIQRSSGQPRQSAQADPQQTLSLRRGNRSSCPRLCKNDSAGQLGATLIQTIHCARIKDSRTARSRFYCCVMTTAPSVFTHPGPISAIHRSPEDGSSRVQSGAIQARAIPPMRRWRSRSRLPDNRLSSPIRWPHHRTNRAPSLPPRGRGIRL